MEELLLQKVRAAQDEKSAFVALLQTVVNPLSSQSEPVVCVLRLSNTPFQQEYRQLCERYGLEYRAVARPAQVSDGSVLIRPELIIVQFAAPQLRPANCNVTST